MTPSTVPLVTATLLASTPAALPGDSVWLGVRYDVAPGWHIYWTNPGDSGMATSLSLQADQGETGPVAWPGPERIDVAGGLVNYGYTGSVTALQPVRIAPDASGRLHVEGHTRWLVCKDDICQPGDAPLALDLQLGRHAGGDRFSAERARLPGPLPKGAHSTRTDTGRTLLLPDPATLTLFPDPTLEDVLAGWTADSNAHGSVLELTLSAPLTAPAHAVVAQHSDQGTTWLDWVVEP